MAGAAVSFGGSVFTKALSNIREKADELEELKEKFGRLVAVVGAGDLKRFIESCSDTASNSEKDTVGIRATRLNASVLKTYLEGAYPGIPESFEQLQEAIEIADTVVMGGTEPGHSTDAVAALAAEAIDADVFVKATDVEGVYDRDPGRNNASKLDKISFKELKDLISGRNSSPGSYNLMDLTACSILERSGIRTVVLDGTSRGEISGVATGEHSGTEIS
ncbi:MAG: UMP kinase [Candidatus Nanohaloarchaea archaeon]|nr:UMP kinase [Candidatus Nanohaloarchaea archaeon]